MSDAIPEGWSVESLDKNIEVLSGFPFKSAHFTDNQSKMGLIRIRDLIKQELKTFYDGDFEDLYVVTKGDILIGMDGDFNIVKWKIKDALLNQRICKIKAIERNGFDSDFLFHSLEIDLQEINASTGATTVKHLSLKDIRGVQRPYPPLPEQQKIAAILSSVDDVIEKTQAQIEKLKDLKIGMMQELLSPREPKAGDQTGAQASKTNGLHHTEFKDSPLGRIPVGWEVKNLNQLITIKHGYAFEGKYFKANKTSYTLLTPGNFNRDGRLYFGQKTKYYDGPIPNEYILKNGDVLVVMTDLTKEMTILGNTIILQSDSIVLHNQRIGKVEPHETCTVTPEFLCFIMNSERVKTHVKDTATGTTVRHTSPTKLLEPLIPVPPLAEQKKIIDVFNSLDSRLTYYEYKLTMKKNIKKALMQDLLTGKVRVKVDAA